jgi:prepilin-type N-terminal cleavage/methylation domain-containing protein
MTNVMKSEKGMTLLEVIVVLAVLGALAAMLSPTVFRYIDDANRARSQADVRAIASAINDMYRDTGRWPFYAATTGQGPIAWAAGDASYLTSNPDCDTADTDLATCDLTAPTLGTGWTGTLKADSLQNQLATNAPGYGTSGNRAWEGPYLDSIPATDAWGRSYLVNIVDANPADNDPDAVLVVSGGPDGIIQTSADQDAQTNVTPGTSDDIIARVK